MAGRTFVKCHGNGGAQVGLYLHALLRPHEYLMAVYVGIKVNAFLFDFAQLGQGKYLKAAGIRKDGPVPVHESVQAAKFLNQSVACADVKMVGIGQFHLGVDFPQIVRGHSALDCAHRPYVHEYRCLNHAVDGLHPGPFCPSVLCYYLIFHIVKPRHLPGQL